MATPTAPVQQPPSPAVPLSNAQGVAAVSWYSFFLSLFGATNGVAVTLGNLLAPQPANSFLASPNGSVGPPTYRTIETGDLTVIQGQLPGTTTDDNALAGNVGEYIASQVPVGSEITLNSGVAADITTIQLSPGDWDVWGSIVLGGTGSITTGFTAWINNQSVTDPGAPNGGAYAAGSAIVTQALGAMRVEVAAGETTMLYLSIKANLSGAVKAYGFLGARRQR